MDASDIPTLRPVLDAESSAIVRQIMDATGTTPSLAVGLLARKFGTDFLRWWNGTAIQRLDGGAIQSHQPPEPPTRSPTFPSDPGTSLPPIDL